MSLRYGALVSDLDGTLVDSAPVILEALRLALVDLRIEMLSERDLASCMGPPMQFSLRELLGPGAPVDEVIAAYRRHYVQNIEETKVMPDAIETIEMLATHGVKLAVATYKPRPFAEMLLRTASMSSRIHILVAPALDSTTPRKANLVRQAADLLGSDRSTTLYVGDHDEDKRAADELGIDFIRYPQTGWRVILGRILALPGAPGEPNP